MDTWNWDCIEKSSEMSKPYEKPQKLLKVMIVSEYCCNFASFEMNFLSLEPNVIKNNRYKKNKDFTNFVASRAGSKCDWIV